LRTFGWLSNTDFGFVQAFYDLHIEDMWLPFFCNTTNILTSQMEIHENGYAWRFIRRFFFSQFLGKTSQN
jgi:lysophospholipid hydrolase